eukprot:4453762-Amphidinium_carterae.1
MAADMGAKTLQTEMLCLHVHPHFWFSHSKAAHTIADMPLCILRKRHVHLQSIRSTAAWATDNNSSPCQHITSCAMTAMS